MANRLLALAMSGLGVAFIIGATQLEDLEFVDPLGYKSFPVIVGILAIIASALLLFEDFRERQKSEDFQEPPQETKSHPFAAAGVLGWMLLMYLLLDIIGFAVIIAVFLFGLTSFFNRGKWVVNGIVSVAFSLAFFFLFTDVIGVPLARGIFNF